MRPGIPGRLRGESSAEGGLKDLAKLAMMSISGTKSGTQSAYLTRGLFSVGGVFRWLRGPAKIVKNGRTEP